jgi:hypothetical protein
MLETHDFNQNIAASAHKGYWLSLAQRGMRPVDKLDYLIRRWAIEDHSSRSPSVYPQTDARLNELQRAIGRYLGAQYDLAQSMPDRLVALLRKLEQPA